MRRPAALIDWSVLEPWHPILAAREVKPGYWIMVDTMGFPYGLVRFVRRGGEVGYRVDRWPKDGESDGELLGYFTNLKAATMASHKRFIDEHARDHGKLPLGRPRQVL